MYIWTLKRYLKHILYITCNLGKQGASNDTMLPTCLLFEYYWIRVVYGTQSPLLKQIRILCARMLNLHTIGKTKIHTVLYSIWHSVILLDGRLIARGVFLNVHHLTSSTDEPQLRNNWIYRAVDCPNHNVRVNTVHICLFSAFGCLSVRARLPVFPEFNDIY